MKVSIRSDTLAAFTVPVEPSKAEMEAALLKEGIDVCNCSLTHIQLTKLFKKNVAHLTKVRKRNNQSVQDRIDELAARRRVRRLQDRRPSFPCEVQAPAMQRM